MLINKTNNKQVKTCIRCDIVVPLIGLIKTKNYII